MLLAKGYVIDCVKLAGKRMLKIFFRFRSVIKEVFSECSSHASEWHALNVTSFRLSRFNLSLRALLILLFLPSL